MVLATNNNDQHQLNKGGSYSFVKHFSNMVFGLPSLASSTLQIITRQRTQWIFCCLHGPSDYLA
jgi:hypothetical protein